MGEIEQLERLFVVGLTPVFRKMLVAAKLIATEKEIEILPIFCSNEVLINRSSSFPTICSAKAAKSFFNPYTKRTNELFFKITN
jgi:hypothetical protein